jgi:hypothetical protein
MIHCKKCAALHWTLHDKVHHVTRKAWRRTREEELKSPNLESASRIAVDHVRRRSLAITSHFTDGAERIESKMHFKVTKADLNNLKKHLPIPLIIMFPIFASQGFLVHSNFCSSSEDGPN